uniref:Ribosomal protein L6 n=1 Tax=Dictyopteris divaricata TaxID=156996 RepID=A0A4Y5T8W9_9PHAE|nr:ribosomal protein L6 [Dictyopteris divaricata]QDB64112.1 ribosomal protein L6 [Dictyopteris divaricata]
MSVLSFCLPPSVTCSAQGPQICMVGPEGCVSLDIPTPFVQKSRIVRFSKPLTMSNKVLFKQAIIGVSLSYVLELSLVGVGYRVEKVANKLYFKLGYSHLVAVRIPEDVVAGCSKNIITLRSAHLLLLKTVSSKIRKLRYPNPYKGTGVLYKGEIIILKEGKKT